jgi:hypothetical protein
MTTKLLKTTSPAAMSPRFAKSPLDSGSSKLDVPSSQGKMYETGMNKNNRHRKIMFFEFFTVERNSSLPASNQ